MTTEQKAKAYDEALELIRDCVPDEDGLVYVRPSDIFFELRESEDERIRKEIIAILQYKYEKFSKDPKYCNAPQWIAWLEKQGKRDARYENLEELLEADTIYQMAMNDAMVEESKTKAMNALSELEIGKLLGIEKQGEQKPQSDWKPSDAQMQALKEACDKRWEPDGLDPLYTLYEQLKKL